jgi:hypothetical protein
MKTRKTKLELTEEEKYFGAEVNPLLRPTTIAKIHQNSRVKVGLNIQSDKQSIRIYKNFYNLGVQDTINFKNGTLETDYSGFYQGPKWLRKKLFDLTDNNSVPGLIVVKLKDGEMNFNEYQYSFRIIKRFDEINVLDSYDHLNNLKDYKHQLAKTRNLIKHMSIEDMRKSSSVDDKNVYTLWPNTPDMTY